MKFLNYIIRLVIVIAFAVGMVALMNEVPPTMIVAVLSVMLAGSIYDEIKCSINQEQK